MHKKVRLRMETVPLLVTVVAVVIVGVLAFHADDVVERLGPVVFTQTYSFLLMIVIGSAVSVMFQTISYARDARERRRTLQREIHEALVAGYNDAKRARRLLQARAREKTHEPIALLDAAEYDRQIEAVSDAQLTIELVTRRVEIDRELFPQNELLQALTTVGKYLNTIVDEWEDVRPAVNGAASVSLARLPELDAFLRSPGTSDRFRDGFKVPFDRALRLMEQALKAGG